MGNWNPEKKPYCRGCNFYQPIGQFIYELEREPQKRKCRHTGICARMAKLAKQSEADDREKHIVLHIEDGIVVHTYVPNDGKSYIEHGQDFDHRTLEGAVEGDGNAAEYQMLQDIIAEKSLILGVD